MRARQGGSAGTPRVLVTGSEHPAGLAAVRALRQGGFEPWAAVNTRAALGARSRAAAGIVDVPDPRADAEGFIDELAGACRRIGAAAVLPGTEAAQLAMVGRRDRFPGDVAVGDAPASALQHATDKTALALLSLRAGLDAPPGRVIGVDDQLASREELSFPAVVKPIRSELTLESGGLQRFEAREVKTPAELDAALRELPDGAGLVQPYIEGELISVCGVSWKGELVVANEHVVDRIWPERCGYCISAETTPFTKERETAIRKLMKELDWSGIFNLQLIERDGRPYVIDLNPRFYMSQTLAVYAGLNLPAIWTSLLLDLPFEAAEGRIGVRFRSEKDDLALVLARLRRGEIGALGALLPRRRTVHALFSIRDPLPLLSIVSDGREALKRRRESKADPPKAPKPAERIAA